LASSALREWHYGGYEGRDDAEMWMPLYAHAGVEFKKDWSTWEAFTKKMSDKAIADAIASNDKTGTAENYDAIVARLKSGMAEIVQQTLAAGGGKSLVVSHGGAIATILFMPEQYHGESIGNGSVTLLRYDNGKYTLSRLE